MTARRLTDAPVFITNLEGALDVVLEILHELSRDGLDPTDDSALNRALAVLAIQRDACEMIVREIERGPEYREARTA